MAWLVYKQDKKINELVLLDYQFTLIGEIVSYQQKSEGDYNIPNEEIYLPLKNMLYEKYDYDVVLSTSQNTNGHLKVESKTKLLIFITVENLSKRIAERVNIASLEIARPNSNKEKVFYNYDCVNQLTNRTHKILPGQKLRLCIVLHSFPKILDLSLLRLKLSMAGVEDLQNVDFWVQRKADGGEIFVSDGLNIPG